MQSSFRLLSVTALLSVATVGCGAEVDEVSTAGELDGSFGTAGVPFSSCTDTYRCKILKVPHYPQGDRQQGGGLWCHAATAAMITNAFGGAISQCTAYMSDLYTSKCPYPGTGAGTDAMRRTICKYARVCGVLKRPSTWAETYSEVFTYNTPLAVNVRKDTFADGGWFDHNMVLDGVDDDTNVTGGKTWLRIYDPQTLYDGGLKWETHSTFVDPYGVYKWSGSVVF
jgi:hypothetical protein